MYHRLSRADRYNTRVITSKNAGTANFAMFFFFPPGLFTTFFFSPLQKKWENLSCLFLTYVTRVHHRFHDKISSPSTSCVGGPSFCFLPFLAWLFSVVYHNEKVFTFYWWLCITYSFCICFTSSYVCLVQIWNYSSAIRDTSPVDEYTFKPVCSHPSVQIWPTVPSFILVILITIFFNKMWKNILISLMCIFLIDKLFVPLSIPCSVCVSHALHVYPILCMHIPYSACVSHALYVFQIKTLLKVTAVCF